jgi:hypothetical protein
MTDVEAFRNMLRLAGVAFEERVLNNPELEPAYVGDTFIQIEQSDQSLAEPRDRLTGQANFQFLADDGSLRSVHVYALENDVVVDLSDVERVLGKPPKLQ